MLLTDAELEQLTERRQPAAQRRALERMGVTYRKRPSGRPAVTWDDVRQGRAVEPPTRPRFDQLPAR